MNPHHLQSAAYLLKKAGRCQKAPLQLDACFPSAREQADVPRHSGREVPEQVQFFFTARMDHGDGDIFHVRIPSGGAGSIVVWNGLVRGNPCRLHHGNAEQPLCHEIPDPVQVGQADLSEQEQRQILGVFGKVTADIQIALQINICISSPLSHDPETEILVLPKIDCVFVLFIGDCRAGLDYFRI